MSDHKVLNYVGASAVAETPSRPCFTPMPVSNDRELMDKAKDGDSAAFEELVTRHQTRIYRLAAQMLRNPAEAEDVTQDTFVRAYAALGQFDGRSQPFTWFYRIAVNLSLNRIRSRKTAGRVASLEDANVANDVAEQRPALSAQDEAVSDRQLYLTLCEGIDSLTQTLRTTLILVAIDGLSHLEAAEVLGCPEGTIAWRIHEARRKLRQYLADRGYAD